MDEKANNKMEEVGINVKVMEGSRRERVYDIILRILGIFLTLTAAIVVGSDKQNTLLHITLIESLPPVPISVTAKWHYLSSFVYLLVTNVLASSYALGSLIYSLTNANLKNKTTLVLITLDIVVMSLLFTATGAVASVGIIGQYGNRHVQWKKVCNVMDSFCHQMTAAFALSLLGSFVFLWLAVLAVWHLHKKLAN